MTKEEEFDLFVMDAFLDLYHIMESRMKAEEERGSGEPTTDRKAEHSEWYSATGSLGVRVFQIDVSSVKDAEMGRHFVSNLEPETINLLDDQNLHDMRNWLDSDEDDEF